MAWSRGIWARTAGSFDRSAYRAADESLPLVHRYPESPSAPSLDSRTHHENPKFEIQDAAPAKPKHCLPKISAMEIVVSYCNTTASCPWGTIKTLYNNGHHTASSILTKRP